jgi:hypothetical protein
MQEYFSHDVDICYARFGSYFIPVSCLLLSGIQDLMHAVCMLSIDSILFPSMCRMWFNFHDEFFFLFLLPPIILYPFDFQIQT